MRTRRWERELLGGDLVFACMISLTRNAKIRWCLLISTCHFLGREPFLLFLVPFLTGPGRWFYLRLPVFIIDGFWRIPRDWHSSQHSWFDDLIFSQDFSLSLPLRLWFAFDSFHDRKWRRYVHFFPFLFDIPIRFSLCFPLRLLFAFDSFHYRPLLFFSSRRLFFFLNDCRNGTAFFIIPFYERLAPTKNWTETAKMASICPFFFAFCAFKTAAGGPVDHGGRDAHGASAPNRQMARKISP